MSRRTRKPTRPNPFKQGTTLPFRQRSAAHFFLSVVGSDLRRRVVRPPEPQRGRRELSVGSGAIIEESGIRVNRRGSSDCRQGAAALRKWGDLRTTAARYRSRERLSLRRVRHRW
jgi:hypothetical protein